jgi:DNA mismatch repair ATPase MutS
MIADKEIEVIQELASRVLKHTQQFIEAVNVLSELDWYVCIHHTYIQTNSTRTA